MPADLFLLTLDRNWDRGSVVLQCYLHECQVGVFKTFQEAALRVDAGTSRRWTNDSGMLSLTDVYVQRRERTRFIISGIISRLWITMTSKLFCCCKIRKINKIKRVYWVQHLLNNNVIIRHECADMFDASWWNWSYFKGTWLYGSNCGQNTKTVKQSQHCFRVCDSSSAHSETKNCCLRTFPAG